MSLSFAMFLLGISAALWAYVALYAQYQLRVLGDIARPMILLALSVFQWTVLYAVEIAVPLPQLKIAAFYLKYVGMVALPVAGLLFVLAYVNYSGWMTAGRRRRLIYVIPAVTLILVLTNARLGLMWTDLRLVNVGEIQVIAETRGVWAWIHIAFAYTLFGVICLMMLRHLRAAFQLHRRSLSILLGAIIFPGLVSFLIVAGSTPLDLIPFAMGISGIAVARHLFSYQLIDLAPIARNIVTESMADGMIVLDSQQKVVALNPAAEKIIGRDKTTLIGETYDAVLHELSQLVAYSEAIEKTATGELVTSRDGRTYYLELRTSPLRDDGKKIIGRVVVIRDITRRKESEAKLRAALDAEKELNALRARFVSIVSHEFRTPMSIIQTATEMVQRYRERMDAEALAAKFDTIVSQIAIMNALIDDVLSLERLQNGKLDFSPETLSAADTIHQLIDELCEDTQIAERVQYLYPQTSTSVQAMLDKKLLRLVVRNLVSNALKYSPQEMPVSVMLDIDGETLKLSVRDQGIGIPKRDQARLFDAFYRAANVGDVPGSGLGLMIVKQALDLHGGTIDFTSAEDKGTTFRVTLPLVSRPDVQTASMMPNGAAH